MMMQIHKCNHYNCLKLLLVVTCFVFATSSHLEHYHSVQPKTTSATNHTPHSLRQTTNVRSNIQSFSSLAFISKSWITNKNEGLVDAILKIQGGAITESDDDDTTSDDEYDPSDNDEYEQDDTNQDDEESDEEVTDSDTSEEEEEEEEEETNDDIPKSKTKNAIANTEYDEPLVLSPMQDMGITLGVMIMCNKLDLNNTKIIRFARFAFIAYIIAMQLFLLYVRYNAKLINDTTMISINNPLSNLLQSQNGNSSNDTDMVKNIANSLLSTQSTIRDYDLQQAKNMNNGLLFPMMMLWFLHFKLGQVQPLFFQTVSGIKEMVLSPLFQIYILGKNLERPFKKTNPMESLQESEVDEEEQQVDTKEEEVDEEGLEEDVNHQDEESDDDEEEESDEESESDEDDDHTDEDDDDSVNANEDNETDSEDEDH